MNISIRFHQVTQFTEVFELVDCETRKLRSYYPEVINCAVVIDKPSHRRRNGNPIRAQLTISFPGKVMVFSKRVDGHNESECALAALSTAFDAAEQAINDYVHKQREVNGRRYRRLFETAFVPV